MSFDFAGICKIIPDEQTYGYYSEDLPLQLLWAGVKEKVLWI